MATLVLLTLTLGCSGRTQRTEFDEGALPGRGQPWADGRAGWVRQLGAVGRDYFTSVAVDVAGNPLVAGSSLEHPPDEGPPAGAYDYSALAMKVSGDDGSTLWSAWYGAAGRVTAANSVAVDTAGDVFVGGNTQTQGESPAQSVAFVRKLSGQDGSLLWHLEFGAKETSGGKVVSLAVTGDGQLVVGAELGLTGDGYTGEALALLLAGNDGSTLWQHRLGGSGYEHLDAVAATRSGAVYACVLDYGGPYRAGAEWETRVVRLAEADGGTEWLAAFSAMGPALAATSESLFMAGPVHLDDGPRNYSDLAARALATEDGALGWETQFGTEENDLAWSAAAAKNGDLIVGGKTYAALGEGEYRGLADAHVTWFSGQDGAHLRTVQFGTTGDDEVAAVAEAPNGTVFAVGSSDGELDGARHVGDLDAFVAKIPP